ncbi:carboxypeptidase regulatory-like domain-containing protein [Polynucleobacter paneuropaeus]|nr:carboxypeptidase regulatory-like domain-containing protein [Polynucleobacter paneuropaeus]
MKYSTKLTAITCLSIALVSFGAMSQVPQPQRANDIAFITGGIGEDEYKDIEAESKRWSLTLQFSKLEPNGRGEWVSGVKVSILNANKIEVFRAISDGPLMLVDLKPGAYQLLTSFDDSMQKRLIVIEAQHSKKLSISWKQ